MRKWACDTSMYEVEDSCNYLEKLRKQLRDLHLEPNSNFEPYGNDEPTKDECRIEKDRCLYECNDEIDQLEKQILEDLSSYEEQIIRAKKLLQNS